MYMPYLLLFGTSYPAVNAPNTLEGNDLFSGAAQAFMKVGAGRLTRSTP